MTGTENEPGPGARRVADDYDIYSLQVSAEISGWLPQQYVEEARRYVTAMNVEADGEDGTALWAWMLEHLVATLLRDRPYGRRPRADREQPLRETLFLARREDRKVVGTISVVDDDRGRGRRYGVEGCWVGGFHVGAQYRGRKLGSLLFDNVIDHLRVDAVTSRRDLPVNLFTRNPLVEEMVLRRGFTPIDLRPDPEDAGLKFLRGTVGVEGVVVRR